MIDDRTRIRGVSQPLPPGESLLWQGAPEWKALARHALHLRVVAGYFGIIILFGLVSALRQGVSGAELVVPLVTQLIMAASVLAAAALYAWLTARNTVYAITDRRVVLKAGLVLPLTINIPFRLIESAWARRFSDGTGQIALGLRPPDRMGFLVLWPHVRPWRLRYPEPMFRGLTDLERIAALLHQAVLNTGPVTAAQDQQELPLPVALVQEPSPVIS